MNLFILLFLIFSGNIYAQECDFQFNQNQINVDYTGDAIAIPFTINLERPNNARSDLCSYAAFFFSRGLANSYDRRVYSWWGSLSYTLENISPAGTLKDFGDHSGPNEFLGTFIERNQSKTLTGVFKMPAQETSLGSGHYFDVVNVTVYAYKSDSNYRVGMTKQLIINVQKRVNIALSIVSEGGSFDAGSTQAVLDFGNMTTGKTLASDLIVKSNIGYRIKMSSQNNGQFKHQSSAQYIPYTFYLAGNTRSLSGSAQNPVTVVTKSGSSIPAGDRYNMRVQLGNISGKPFGEYSDYITITVQSN